MPRSLKKQHIDIFLLVFLFFLGFLFRLILMAKGPQPLVFDQVQYHDFAQGILKHGLYVTSFRVYGYPLFIALFDGLFGTIKILGIYTLYIAQALLDCATGLLVFILSKKLLNKSTLCWFSYILYLFNPITSPYTGVMLSEVLSTFLLVLVFLLLMRFLEKRAFGPLTIAIFILGYLAQVRPVFLLFGVILLFWSITRILKSFSFRRIIFSLLLCFYFFAPFLYQLFGNLVYFREFSLMDVDNYSLLNFYISLYVEKSTVNLTSIWDYPPEITYAFTEYPGNSRVKEQRHEVQRRFFGYAVERIKKEPYLFVKWRAEKFFLVWEKPSLYPYMNPSHPLFSTGIYWINIFLLCMATIGSIWYWRQRNQLEKSQITFFQLVLFLFFYISAIHIFTECLPRYSLPAYPFIFLYGGVGFSLVFRTVRSIISGVHV